MDLAGCSFGADPPTGAAPRVVASAASPPAPALSSAPRPEPAQAPAAATLPSEVRVHKYAAEGAFVLRGGRADGRAVLFGGQCAQPQAYAEAIKLAAARRVQLVALRGDKPCTGEYRGWTFDLEALSGRIDRTFRALGLGEPRDVLLIGYSQGASVAEMLAAREPDKFTRVVLIAKPSRPEPWRFRKIKAVATMAGTRDTQALMVAGSRTLAAAGVRARYFPLPGARHGEMGDDPEGTFESVLAWLYEPSTM
jgi:pimeloyl-ACP methyl ester carboxylesterase